jgi:Replication initiator protein, pSAM2
VADRETRADRLSHPLARDVVKAVAEAHGACIRPVQLRKTNLDTGETEQVLVPCGATLASVCPPCAERNKALRAAQCREGWHLDTEPIPAPAPPDDYQQWLAATCADLQASRNVAAEHGEDTAELDELIGAVDDELRHTGIRGTLGSGGGTAKTRRRRSTRRRQDTPDLPHRTISPYTLGRTYTAPDGKVFRPSMFLTLTCDTYGKVRGDGTPVDPGSYDYQRAARDAIHFPALFDRLIQNLRRYLGYDLQYFATIEPQKRLAPHAHIATRGTIPRTGLRQVLAATYHQVWWPATDVICFDGDHLPIWHEASGRYLDPDTGELLPTWDEALDAIGPHDQPLHVARFGAKFDAQGVLAGSKDSARCIGYLTKYLVKDLGTCHTPETDAQREHMARLIEALRYEPCSPTCANWLRYGITPKHPRKGLVPGACKGKAHQPGHLGYAGRRVLVSRKWSGKTLADHRGDRQQWLMDTLGLSATVGTGRYRWETVTPSDPDYLPPPERLTRVIAERMQWKQALDEARRRAQESGADPPATGRAA